MPCACGPDLLQVRGKAEAARKAQATAPTAATGVYGSAGAAAGTSTDPAEPGPSGSEVPTAAAAAEAGPEPAPAAPRPPYANVGANTTEAFGWKRCCESWPSVRALWAARRAAAGEPGLPEAVGEQGAIEAQGA